MSFFEVIIEVWPHSTGRGSSVDQMQAGAREQTYRVKAENIREAMNLADTICLGLKQNPIVWSTPIKGIGQVDLSGSTSHEPFVRCLTERGECYKK